MLGDNTTVVRTYPLLRMYWESLFRSERLPAWHIPRCCLCICTCHIAAMISTGNWSYSLTIIRKKWLKITYSFFFLALVLQNLIGLDPTVLYSGSHHSITSWYIWQSVYISRFTQKTRYLILAFLWELSEIFFIVVMDDWYHLLENVSSIKW